MSLWRSMRNWTAGLFVAVAHTLAPIEGRYEAGQHYSSRRTWLPGWVRDARFDADQATRIEIMRKSRYFERNNAILNRLADLFEQYTVGPNGLRYVPASSDPEWNKRAAAWWEDWCTKCDLTSLQPFGTIQSLCARSWAIDGEIFLLKTSGRPRAGERSYPRIQLIESHRVETPPTPADGARIIDGIEVDERGRPVAYWVKETAFGEHGFMGDETFRRVPAEQIIHIFEASRPGQYRGLPMTYAVLNDLHDLDDLQLFSLDGAKEASLKTAVIKTKTGELSMDELRRARFNIGGTQGTSGGSKQERSAYYKEHFRAAPVVLERDDEYQEFTVTRPSESERALWDHLTSKVCAGFGISKLLVFPWSVQGTVVRADLDVAATFFRSRSAVLASKFTEVWLYVMQWAVLNERQLADPPADWKRVAVRAPRSVNVDVGRNSTALISEYEAGWRTLEEICGELGMDWRDVLRQRAVELAEAAALEKEFSLPEGSLIAKVLEALKAKQAQQQAEHAQKLAEQQAQQPQMQGAA